jgi:hypothetical protein
MLSAREIHCSAVWGLENADLAARVTNSMGSTPMGSPRPLDSPIPTITGMRAGFSVDASWRAELMTGNLLQTRIVRNAGADATIRG